MGHDASRERAVAIGHTLLRRAVPAHDGWTWTFRQDRDFILPNFSHGAAGIGYFLAILYEDTGDEAFLEAALGAATYLRAIARTDDDVFLVPYGWPDEAWEGRYDVGWAHGPAGTARLFYRLWQITGEDRWMEQVRACARGLQRSGVPGSPAPGFGEEPFKPDRRFGTASVAAFFLDLYGATPDTSYLAFARSLTEHLLQQATRLAGRLRWEAPRYAFFEHAGEPAAFTGYFYGAAGYGLLLLQLDAAEQGRTPPGRLPDNPFEAYAAPGNLRIDFAPLADGNGLLFTDETRYTFQNGEITDTRPQVHPLLLLGFDVYHLPPEETTQKLGQLGFDLTRMHTTTWQGRPTYVVGAEDEADKRSSFWIDHEHLYFTRLLRYIGPDTSNVQEVQFNAYQRLGKGWIAPEVLFFFDEQPVLKETYREIQSGISLDTTLYDPTAWRTSFDAYYVRDE